MLRLPLLLVAASSLLSAAGTGVAASACNLQLNATGPYDKSNSDFTFDVLSSVDVNVTSISVRLLESLRSQAVLSVSFKEESWASSALSWQPVAVVRDGWVESVPKFSISQLLRAGVQSSFQLQCSSNSIRYNFQPYLAGVQTAAVTDGTLSILPGVSNGRTRYFAGYVGYTPATPACTVSPPAPSPPPAPPPSTFVLPTLPTGGVYVYSEADIVAAIADPTVTNIVLAASLALSGSALTIPSTSTVLSISGNAESCALAAAGSAIPVDYDYIAYVAPVTSPLSNAICTINGGTLSRVFVVETPSLALSNLQILNGWAVSHSDADGGAVYMSDAANPSTCTSLVEADGCVFGGTNAYSSGGAIFACNARISNSLFRNNGASNGADLYVVGSLDVQGSVFLQGWAYTNGGSIYLDSKSGCGAAQIVQ